MIIEENVGLHVTAPAPGGRLSLEPAGLAALCGGTRTGWKALEQVRYAKSSEQGFVECRWFVYFGRDMIAGEQISPHEAGSVMLGLVLPQNQMDSFARAAFCGERAPLYHRVSVAD